MKYVLNLNPIKHKLIDLGMTMKQLAKKLKVHETTLYGYFGKRHSPSIKLILEICNLLKMNPGELFQDRGE